MGCLGIREGLGVWLMNCLGVGFWIKRGGGGVSGRVVVMVFVALIVLD